MCITETTVIHPQMAQLRPWHDEPPQQHAQLSQS
jgi:hypothetical protein